MRISILTCLYLYLDFKDDVKKLNEIPYTLPDGQQIFIGNERVRCTEALFHPGEYGFDEALGIQHLVCDAIAKCDSDLTKQLYSSIYLSGGSTMFSGFKDRLHSEVTKCSKVAGTSDISIRASENQLFLAWLGEMY
eukprot:TRINITY_DN1180_c0_g1_i5.p2 TRINITY_DN1180_c0_g1~~TRINITY_DN1180_c0_g1_i5.p2  ORF type:complete len:136 (-),score=17.83 TRINITY_DN1180_c0_g1_i5:208-615(-)